MARPRPFLLSAVLLSVLCSAGSASADTLYKNVTALRWNPIGVVNAADLRQTLQLYDSESAALKDNYVAAAATAVASPAFIRPGVKLEFAPATVLRLGVQYEYVQFFGAFDHLQSFPDAGVDYSDTAIKASGDEAESHSGQYITLYGLLQAKVWKIAARSNVKLQYTDFSVGDGDAFFYDPLLDILSPVKGSQLANDADLLFLFDGGFVAAIRHSMVKVLDPDAPAIQRLGPLLSYPLDWMPGKTKGETRVFALFQWWLAHPYRTGTDVSQAIPMLATGLVISGDVL